MERVYAADTEDTVWTEEAILSMYERHALKRNHVLVALFLGIVTVFVLTTSLRYGFDRPEVVGKLLTERSCEGCDLSRANLAGANLSGVNLSRATLRGADLSVADLSHSDLSFADLSGAILYRANLSGADLRGADMTGAHLLLTNLSGAIWVDGRPLAKKGKERPGSNKQRRSRDKGEEEKWL